MRQAMWVGGALTMTLLGAILSIVAGRATTADARGTSDEAAAVLQEVSVFEKTGTRDPSDLARGQIVACKVEPDKEVKVYPKRRSAHPFYGSIQFGKSLVDPGTGMQFHFLLDESAGTGKGYDRLYFDANRDLDLTNDLVLRPMKDPPANAVPSYWKDTKQKVIFDYLTVPFDYGPGLGNQPFRLMPRLMVNEKAKAGLHFVATTAREGKIRVGKHEYGAVLAQHHLISGRFDSHFVSLHLTPCNAKQRLARFWDDEYLGGMRLIDGRLYRFSAPPRGDKLFAKPYQGDFGTFANGRGSRDAMKPQTLLVRGALRSSAGNTVPVGVLAADGSGFDRTKECRIPVGDYLPTILSMEYGRLRVSLSENYHSEGCRQDRQGRPSVFGVKIRKERPFVWDFGNKPDVMFTEPPKDRTFRRGDEIRVAALLTDPIHDVMIRRLSDTTRKQKETYKLPDGKEQTLERELSLDPTVTITDSRAKQVAAGKMPFG